MGARQRRGRGGWTSIRNLDPDRLTVQFRQGKSSPPIGAMSGEWIVEGQPDGGSLVRLLRNFSAIDDDPAALRWIANATDRNSQTELATLKAAAEQADERDSLIVQWGDSVPSTGAADDAYEFVWNAREWPSRLPHVSKMTLEEPEPNVQVMEMDTVTKDGSAHTTKSIRVGFPRWRSVQADDAADAAVGAYRPLSDRRHPRGLLTNLASHSDHQAGGDRRGARRRCHRAGRASTYSRR